MRLLGTECDCSDGKEPVYYSGGGGIIFSRKALELFGAAATESPKKLFRHLSPASPEDMAIGVVMARLNISTVDTREGSKCSICTPNVSSMS